MCSEVREQESSREGRKKTCFLLLTVPKARDIMETVAGSRGKKERQSSGSGGPETKRKMDLEN